MNFHLVLRCWIVVVEKLAVVVFFVATRCCNFRVAVMDLPNHQNHAPLHHTFQNDPDNRAYLDSKTTASAARYLLHIHEADIVVVDYKLNIEGGFDNIHSFVDNNFHNYCTGYMATPFQGEGEEHQIVVEAVVAVGDDTPGAFVKLLQHSDCC